MGCCTKNCCRPTLSAKIVELVRVGWHKAINWIRSTWDKNPINELKDTISQLEIAVMANKAEVNARVAELAKDIARVLDEVVDLRPLRPAVDELQAAVAAHAARIAELELEVDLTDVLAAVDAVDAAVEEVSPETSPEPEPEPEPEPTPDPEPTPEPEPEPEPEPTPEPEPEPEV